MRYLLDTHIVLWWWAGDKRLSSKYRQIIKDPKCEILVSAASAWEIVIKSMLGRIEFPLDEWAVQLQENHFSPLPIRHDHAIEVATLPPIHSDPFDRMLIAQALVEGVDLISQDDVVRKYLQ